MNKCATPRDLRATTSICSIYDHAHGFLPDRASICSFGQGGGGKKDQIFLLKTPQFQQQVAPNVQPAAFFRRTGVQRRDVRAMEAAGSVRLPGNSATGSQFPRQTEGLRAIWTF